MYQRLQLTGLFRPLRVLCALLLSALAADPAAAQPQAAAPAVRPLTAPGTPSPLFAARVNGTVVPVIAFKDIHYAQFSVTDAAHVELQLLSGPATRARVQPTSLGIAATVRGDRIGFDLPRPMQVVVQVDYLPKLFLFAVPPPVPPPPGATDAAAAGAVGDGVTDNTDALQAAVQALPRGGTLVIPAGHFRTGTLRLHSDMTLHLAPGALLQAVDDPAGIKAIPGAPGMIGFLTAENVTNLSLTGTGTLDANGFVIRRAYERAEQVKKKAGRAIFIRNGRDIVLRDLTVRDSYSWNVDVQFTDALTISGVKILSDVRLSNHDGFDIESCCGVSVSDCFIFSEDDGLTPKARAGREIVENHTYRNCVIWAHKANGIRVGSESACASMRNFLFENIYLLNGADGIRLDTTEGAVYENMTFRNVWMEEFLQHYDDRYERDRSRRPTDPSRSLVFYVNRTERRGVHSPLGKIRNITFENVHWSDGRVPAALILPDAVKRFAAETGQTPLIDAVRFSGCTRAGQPLTSAAEAGFFKGDAALTSGFTFQ